MNSEIFIYEEPLKEQITVLDLYGYAACQRLLPEIYGHFPQDFVVEGERDVPYMYIDITARPTPYVIGAVRDAVENAQESIMLVPRTLQFDSHHAHVYDKYTAAKSETVYYQKECKDFTILFVVLDGADIYVGKGKESMMIPVPMGHYLILSPGVSFWIQNIKRRGVMIVSTIAPTILGG